jgi:hypothetical protein
VTDLVDGMVGFLEAPSSTSSRLELGVVDGTDLGALLDRFPFV